MGQRKGQTGNPNGRPKGSANKTTKTARQWLIDLIDLNRGQIEKDIKTLEPKDRLIIIEKLLSYTMPKMSSSQISIEQLTEDHLDIIIDELTHNLQKDENQN